ncbi:ABC transporter permease, partial [Singulisphaera rosea]
TSLAEERQRGSLDVLLTTPLSTRSIVLAKWWGAFSRVPPLVVLPVLISGSLATRSGVIFAPFLIGGLVLAYGAAITSLGLALAIWIPRMGRAIALTSGLYIISLVGAVPFGMLLFGRSSQSLAFGVASASPFFGVGFSNAIFSGEGGPKDMIEPQAIWLVVWILTYGLIAFGLLVATLMTFNRCLGRIDDGARKRGRNMKSLENR